MRTVFEDTNEAASRENPKTGHSIPIFLWLLAILFLVGSFAVYRKVSSRVIEPPPPPIAFNDPKQVNELLYKFNQLIKEENFVQAQGLLTADAQKRLADSGKTLREVLLAQRKGKVEKIIEAVPLTENAELRENSVVVGSTYYFEKNETIYIPYTIIKEKIGDIERLAIDDWEEREVQAAPSPDASSSPGASPAASPAAAQPEKK